MKSMMKNVRQQPFFHD